MITFYLWVAIRKFNSFNLINETAVAIHSAAAQGISKAVAAGTP